MAKPETVKFGKMKVSLGDGASPEVFTAPCGFTSKSFSRSKSLNEVQVPDCADPDAAAWSERDVQSMSATISGSGVLAVGSLPDWEAFLDSTDSVNCKVEITQADAKVIVYLGAFHLESFEVTAELGNKLQVSVTMQSDGPVTYTAAA